MSPEPPAGRIHAALEPVLRAMLLESDPRWRVSWETPALARAARRWGTARLMRRPEVEP